MMLLFKSFKCLFVAFLLLLASPTTLSHGQEYQFMNGTNQGALMCVPCCTTTAIQTWITTKSKFENQLRHCRLPTAGFFTFLYYSYCLQLFNCIESSADHCLPTQGHCLRHAPLSGWNRSAHTLKQSAQFWHKVWSDYR